MEVTELEDGIVVCGDSTDPEVLELARATFGTTPLIVTDPPYGQILADAWDQGVTVEQMLGWSLAWLDLLEPQGAFYCWGGIGRPGNRLFFRYIIALEDSGVVQLANLITWAKKRAYGVQHNYLFTREECAYFCKGDIKKPRCFQVPLLGQRRGYEGYNPDYPARSEFLRRTNVWTDVTEILQGKVHPAEKPARLFEVPIAVHTTPGEWVVDPFAGSGVTAKVARALGRRFFVVERDPQYYKLILRALQ